MKNINGVAHLSATTSAVCARYPRGIGASQSCHSVWVVLVLSVGCGVWVVFFLSFFSAEVIVGCFNGLSRLKKI